MAFGLKGSGSKPLLCEIMNLRHFAIIYFPAARNRLKKAKVSEVFSLFVGSKLQDRLRALGIGFTLNDVRGEVEQAWDASGLSGAGATGRRTPSGCEDRRRCLTERRI